MGFWTVAILRDMIVSEADGRLEHARISSHRTVSDAHSPLKSGLRSDHRRVPTASGIKMRSSAYHAISTDTFLISIAF
jgi:hypothetical protein